MKWTYPEGATPIDPNEAEGLIPNVRLQEELNDFEAAAIARARQWAVRSRKLRKDLLSEAGLRLLHQKMFEDVWEWAGQYRTRDKNIGRPWHYIASELASACEDYRFQIENGTFKLPEIAVRFHHRLVFIHPFPNGNGRHARLAADLLLLFNRESPLTWGEGAFETMTRARAAYIEALRAADQGDFAPLLAFATPGPKLK